jgi:hypothetical protein
MANQVKTPIQNYFEKVLYENLTFLPSGFYSCLSRDKKNRNKPLYYHILSTLQQYGTHTINKTFKLLKKSSEKGHTL